MLQDPNFATVTGCDRPAAVTTQREAPVEPELVVEKYEELAYPRVGRTAHIQGVVVIQTRAWAEEIGRKLPISERKKTSERDRKKASEIT